MMPRLYTAEQVADDALQCTASWLKEMARQRRIPFSMVGGQYRFSSAHIEEIIRLFEQKPHAERLPTMRRRTDAASSDAPALKARRPRRTRSSDSETGSATDPAAANTTAPYAQQKTDQP